MSNTSSGLAMLFWWHKKQANAATIFLLTFGQTGPDKREWHPTWLDEWCINVAAGLMACRMSMVWLGQAQAWYNPVQYCRVQDRTATYTAVLDCILYISGTERYHITRNPSMAFRAVPKGKI